MYGHEILKFADIDIHAWDVEKSVQNREKIFIHDWNYFVKLSDIFDEFYNTRTMVTYLTLDEIRKNYSYNSDEHIQNQWQYYVDTVFAHNNIRTTDDMTNEEFSPFNNVYTFQNSFKQFGHKIIHPIHAYVFDDLICLHPGNKRTKSLYKHYKKKVPLIITDYTGTHPDLGKKGYNFKNKYCYYRLDTKLHNHTKYPAYKEVNAKTGKVWKDCSFGAIERLKEKRIFEYKNTKVYCNNRLILEKTNGEWDTVL